MTNMNQDWERMLAGQLSEQEGSALLTESLAELEHVIESSPRARDSAIRILELQLTPPLMENSWDDLMKSLGALIGPGPAYLLTWVSIGDWDEQMNQLSTLGSPDAIPFLHELVAIFGTTIRRAVTIRNEWPDDWQTYNLNVVENQIGGGYRISLKLDKTSGDKVTLEGPPDSFLILARILLEGLIIVGDLNEFSPDKVDEFRRKVTKLEKILTAEPQLQAEGGNAEPIAVAEVAQPLDSAVNQRD
jgi:hypothetical protein